MALTIIRLGSCVLLSALLCGNVQAAGRGASPARSGGAGVPHAVQRGPMPAGVWARAHDARHGLPRGARRWALGGAWGGYPAALLWPETGFGGGPVTLVLRPAPGAVAADRHAFENLEARAGMKRGPAPMPTLYRLEGPRRNPAARVIRIAGADEGSLRRSRFAHAETGALMLTVPGR